MKLSVIIPTRSRYNNLVQVLTALDNQTLERSEYEIIVSDDNSNDETQSVINQFKGKPFKYIFNCVPKPHTWNASIPRNLGALISDPSTQAYLFIDSDVVLPSHALKTYADDFANNPDRVIIGPYDFYREGNEQIQVADVRNKKFEEVDIKETFNQPTDGLACFGGNLLIPKKIFWLVNGFSTDTHIGLEDGDMGLKLWKKQIPFSYEKSVRGKHLWHQTPTDRFPSNMREHIDKLNIKHFGTTDPDYGIIEASREAYESWGITGWIVPESWKQSQIEFGLKFHENDKK